MKRAAIVTVAVILAMGSFGCSAPASQESKAGTNSNVASGSSKQTMQDLVLVDANYVASEYGLHYALEIENPNEGYVARTVNIELTGRHPDGSIAFSESTYAYDVYPGAPFYYASAARGEGYSQGDTLEMNVSVDSSAWKKVEANLPDNLYTFENVSITPASRGSVSAKGEITMTEDLSLDSIGSMRKPQIVCILRDANGAIITGFSEYASKELRPDQPTVFDINSHFDPGDFASAEMHASF